MPTDTQTTRIPHSWLWRVLPDDCDQELALLDLQYPHLTPRARMEMLSYRLRTLRHQVWDREVTRIPRALDSLRPSKLTKRTGYRKSSAAHQAARMSVPAEIRRQIAQVGAQARRKHAA